MAQGTVKWCIEQQLDLYFDSFVGAEFFYFFLENDARQITAKSNQAKSFLTSLSRHKRLFGGWHEQARETTGGIAPCGNARSKPNRPCLPRP
jgi:hypothetical protein